MESSQNTTTKRLIPSPLLLVLFGGIFAVLTGAGAALFGFIGALLGIAVSLGIFLALAVFKNPWLGVLLVTLTIPFERFGSLEVAGLTLRLSQVFGALTVVAFIAAVLVARRVRLQPHPGAVPIILFLVVTLLSLLMAENLMRGVMVFLFVFFTVLVHFLISSLVTTKERLQRIIKTLLIITGVIAVFGLFQFFGDVIGLPTSITGLRDLYTSDVFGFPRVQSTFLEPLYFANFLLIPIGLLLSYLFSPQRVMRPLFLFLLLGLAVLNLVLTLSRGGYIGLFITALVVVVYSFRKVFTPSRILFGALLIIIIGYAFTQIFAFTGQEDIFLGRFVTQATDIFSGASFFDRADTFSQALDLFKQHPWLGVGIGNFGPAIAAHPLQQPEGGWLIVNNEFLEILAETGILGFTAFVAFLSVLFFRSLRLLRAAQDSFTKRTLIGLFAAFLGVLAQYQTFSILFIMHIWFLFGLLVAVQNLVEKETRNV
ncbi:MAG: O-antigen ligase family protein [Patescibacteria group bacterium]|jgi:O-antigen ligase